MIGLMGVAGFGPLLTQFFLNQWKQEAHQFFPLAIAGAALLAWRGCGEARVPLVPGSGRVTLPLLLAALAILFLAALSWSPWLGMVALLLEVYPDLTAAEAKAALMAFSERKRWPVL